MRGVRGQPASVAQFTESQLRSTIVGPDVLPYVDRETEQSGEFRRQHVCLLRDALSGEFRIAKPGPGRQYWHIRRTVPSDRGRAAQGVSVWAARVQTANVQEHSQPAAIDRQAGISIALLEGLRMGKLNVKTVSSNEDRTLPIFAELEEISDRIQDRAYQLFSDRGFQQGRDLDDWLEAERLICWPTSELVEHDKDFTIDVALAGFKPDEISVTATPSEIIVKAEQEERQADEKAVTHFSEFRSRKALRRFALPEEVSTDRISAKLQDGILEIQALKAGASTKAPAKKRKTATKKKTVKKAAAKKTAKKTAKKKTATKVGAKTKKQ